MGKDGLLVRESEKHRDPPRLGGEPPVVAAATLAVLLCAVVTTLGTYWLAQGFSLGARLEACAEGVCLGRVAATGPAAAAGLREGDRLASLAGHALSPLVTSPDPDYLSTWEQRRAFFSEQERLHQALSSGPVEAVAVRDGVARRVTLRPERLGLEAALGRTLPVHVVAWVFLVVGLLVIRRRANALSLVNGLSGAAVCMSFSALAAYTSREVALPELEFRVLAWCNYLGSMTATFAFAHLGLLFPKPGRILARFPRAPRALWGVLALIVLGEAAAVLPPHFTGYFPMSVCLLAFGLSLVVGYLRERDLVVRKQTQWVVVGFSTGCAIWLGLTAVPVMFGEPLLSEELSLLPTVVVPLSLALAITRYQLMSIGGLVDAALGYLFTIAILQLVEIAAWLLVYPQVGLPRPILFVGVLLAGALYLPSRELARWGIQRLFRRSTYQLEREIERFALDADPTRPALSQLLEFAKKVLRQGGHVVLVRTPGGSVATELSEGATDSAGAALRRAAPALLRLLARRPGVRFGYTLQDQGLLEPDEELGAAMVAGLGAPEGAERLVVLLPRRDRVAYARKDASLFETLAAATAHLLQAEVLRREKAVLEAALTRQREELTKELHDGLGALLTNANLAFQTSDRLLGEDPVKARTLLRTGGSLVREAMDSLRTGLALLDDPRGEAGLVIASLRGRGAEPLRASGVEVTFESSPEAEAMRLGQRGCLHLTRSLGEALANVAKHAAAKSVRISFRAAGAFLEARVQDDGRGFEPGGLSGGRGLGHLRKRMEELGGRADIDSTPGKGTTVLLRVPVQDLAEDPRVAAPG